MEVLLGLRWVFAGRDAHDQLPAAPLPGHFHAYGATFRAIASLEDLEIVVAGERRPLRAGMGGEARIVTQNLTLLELAFEPMRALKENLGSSP
jgi:hypothetical protein